MTRLGETCYELQRNYRGLPDRVTNLLSESVNPLQNIDIMIQEHHKIIGLLRLLRDQTITMAKIVESDTELRSSITNDQLFRETDKLEP